jgi:hypothetical protein
MSKSLSNNEQRQQGDVLTKMVKCLPAGCKKLPADPRGIVLAEGEVTGHYHGITMEGVELHVADNGARFVVNTTDKEVALNHQEHKTITLAPNSVHQVGIVQEFDYTAQMARNVAD